MIELECDRRERQQPDDPHATSTEPDEVPDQQRQPDPQEGRPLEQPERTEQPGDRRRVVERAQPTDTDLIGVGRIDVPVREGVEADGPLLGCDDDEQVAEEQKTRDDGSVADRPPHRAARDRGRHEGTVLAVIGSLPGTPSTTAAVVGSSGGRTPACRVDS